MKLILLMKLISLIILLYLELTIGEVIIHKYIMHNKEDSFIRRYGLYGEGHVVHHHDVLDDMKLKEDHSEEGLFFALSDVVYVSIITFIIWFPTIRMFYNVKWYYVLGLSVFLGFLYRQLWDFLHYSFHQIDELEKYKSNPLFYWLFYNHSMHHLNKGLGKGNYNIIFPGGDFILGTYKSVVNNEEYCMNPLPQHEGICQKEKDGIPLKHGFKWK